MTKAILESGAQAERGHSCFADVLKFRAARISRRLLLGHNLRPIIRLRNPHRLGIDLLPSLSATSHSFGPRPDPPHTAPAARSARDS